MSTACATSARRPASLRDRSVQVVKGSDSTLGGRGSAGGTINIISKLPKLGDFASADASFGNASYKRVTGDVNHQLSDTIAFRIEGMWHDQDVAGRDAIWQKRWGVAPSITIGLGTPTRLTAAYYHLHSERAARQRPALHLCLLGTVCNAPAGNFVLSEPVQGNVTTLGGDRRRAAIRPSTGSSRSRLPQVQHRSGDIAVRA
jgi:catecholate siderophore receptor